jgi:UDP-glucose 4-epimerase
MRHAPAAFDPLAPAVQVGDLDAQTDWSAALAGVNAVVHTAARVHVMQEVAADPLAEFRRVNVQGTLNLARQAAQAGVRRLVFISSVKVNGEATLAGHPFTAQDMPAPLDAYGISKHEAEEGLRNIALSAAMDVAIIRPPLVYGPGVKANFAALMRAVQRGWPLPLGSIHNQRSLVGLDNLIDLIAVCLVHPNAANQTFVVSDGHDLSTAELVQNLARAAGVSARLWPVPVWMLRAGAALLGRSAAVQRLCGNLQVDISRTQTLLDWTPPVPAETGFRRAFAASPTP